MRYRTKIKPILRTAEAMRTKEAGKSVRDCGGKPADTLESARLRHPPFDRMLIAQAQTENLAILTTDPIFKKHDVEIVWWGR
ncbi:MAG: hypothetical protein ACRD2O_02650 [Terriglobia bacterium]